MKAPAILSVSALSLMAGAARAGLTSITIANPSFQADTFGGVGYASQNGNVVTGWNIADPAAQGVTGPGASNGGHFFDGAPVDGDRAGFAQGGTPGAPRVFSQDISGLTPGARYIAQLWARGRNCCGDSPAFDLTYGSQVLVDDFSTGTGVWHAISVPFTASAASGSLAISSWALAGLDGSLAIDNVQVYQQDADYITLLNPSFEAGASFGFPGYSDQVAGWTRTGGGGYNHAGNSPFADNGLYPEGNTVAFIQQNGSFSQVVSGLAPGQQYLLELDYNSRFDGDDGHIRVELDGISLLDSIITPVGGSNPWYHLAAPWTATGNSATLSILGIANGADSSIVFDNVNLRIIPEPSVAAAVLVALSGLALRRRRLI